MKPPKRLFKREQPDDEGPEMPTGQLRARMRDPDLHAEIKQAEVIFGVHPEDGQRTGPYYGIAAIKRIVRRGESEALRVLNVPVDPDTDDIDTLCAMVQHLKGAHCYEAFVPVNQG